MGNYQRKGLGEFLLKLLEKIAKKWLMEKVMLTVLTENEGAMKFYKRHNYKVDTTSPEYEKSYVILSKYVL